MHELKRQLWISIVAFAVGGGGLARAEECVEPDCIRRVPCESADDCGVYRKCQAGTTIQCPDDLDLSCRPGEDDDECSARTSSLMKSECEQVSRKLCQPVWQLDCSSDAFCGKGLQCVDHGCVASGECKVDADCPQLFRCTVVDGGYCESGKDCVGGQRKLHRCSPPRVEGADGSGAERPDDIGAADEANAIQTSATETDGCNVRRAGERSGTRDLAWIAIAVLAGFILRTRGGSRRR
jgi:hypothetical protein